MVKILLSFSLKITVLQIHIKRKKLHRKVQIYTKEADYCT